MTGLLAEARQLIAEGKNDEGGVKLYRAHKGLPKYKPLIKYLSETGVKALMQKTENTYMQDNNRRMPEITDDLFFVIDEKLNSVELTDKGHEVLSKYFNEDGFFRDARHRCGSGRTGKRAISRPRNAPANATR